MSTRVQLIIVLGVAAIAGVVVLVLGWSRGGGEGFVLAALGGLAIVIAMVGIIATLRWLNPSTRLPGEVRAVLSSVAWRRSVVSLELRHGERIRCVVIRPGGYVVPRKTDPPFDARDVVAIVPATEEDFAIERERQARGNRT